jgi:hypothetical protein
MKWIEMVRARASCGMLEKGMPDIVKQVDEIRKTPGIADVMVLKHALFEGDLAVVLLWDNDHEPGRTPEGMVLAGNLKNIGLVDHGVWTAVADFAPCMKPDAQTSSSDKHLIQ